MFHDLLNLFYPKICNCCNEILGKNEMVLCTRCLHELPLTNYHLDNENLTKKVFYGRVNIENASSLLVFEKKGMVQNLIHNLKYRGHEDIGIFLGKWMGAKLSHSKVYEDINKVIPVPLHKKKLKSRGFNQVEGFGREIAKCLNSEYVDDVLVKKSASKTQTLKKRLSRWGIIEESFFLEKAAKLENSHILLVDDLITTGATLEACANKLGQIKGVKISIATMAITN